MTKPRLQRQTLQTAVESHIDAANQRQTNDKAACRIFTMNADIASEDIQVHTRTHLLGFDDFSLRGRGGSTQIEHKLEFR
jgi:hypothetical protein